MRIKIYIIGGFEPPTPLWVRKRLGFTHLVSTEPVQWQFGSYVDSALIVYSWEKHHKRSPSLFNRLLDTHIDEERT